MSCTFETMKEYMDPFTSLARIADRNGRYENEKEAEEAAQAAGYDLNKIAVVFFM